MESTAATPAKRKNLATSDGNSPGKPRGFTVSPRSKKLRSPGGRAQIVGVFPGSMGRMWRTYVPEEADDNERNRVLKNSIMLLAKIPPMSFEFSEVSCPLGSPPFVILLTSFCSLRRQMKRPPRRKRLKRRNTPNVREPGSTGNHGAFTTQPQYPRTSPLSLFPSGKCPLPSPSCSRCRNCVH